MRLCSRQRLPVRDYAGHKRVPIAPLTLTAFTLVTALGRGVAQNFAALQECRTGLAPCNLPFATLPTFIGRVGGVETAPITGELAAYDCRNNRLAQLALREDDFESAVAAARKRHGARRIAVILGTSTSGILETETAYRDRDTQTGALPQSFSYRHTHNVFATADFVRCALNLAGPAMMISTACSSSAKVFASAHRLISLGICDAAVVGGVDSLCATTLFGFSSLELVAVGPCRPADATRDGISIGEAAGFALLERPARASGVALLGYGESSDAYHMSSPHPEGHGAHRAMEQALASAELAPSDVDYVNLHGTASKANDAAEDRAVHRVLGGRTRCSSTKGWTGHTLGAAGITEAIFAALCVQHGFVPGSLNTVVVDPSFQSRIVLANENGRVKHVLSNSFGFGGNNCSLIFGELS